MFSPQGDGGFVGEDGSDVIYGTPRERRLRENVRPHRVLQRVDDSRWRRCRRVLGRVPRAARRLPAPAHRRISGRRTLRARPGGASRGGCQEREKKLRRAASRSPRGRSLACSLGLANNAWPLIRAHRSMGPAARGVATECFRHRAEFHRRRLRRYRLDLAADMAPIAINLTQTRYTSQDVGKLFILFSFSFSPSLALFSFLLPFSTFPLRADVTKSAVANALRSGLPLENREEELLPRGESIPRSLWWSKGACRNERRRGGAEKAGEGCHGEGGWHWEIGGGVRDVRWGATLQKRAKGVVCTARGALGRDRGTRCAD